MMAAASSSPKPKMAVPSSRFDQRSVFFVDIECIPDSEATDDESSLRYIFQLGVTELCSGTVHRFYCRPSFPLREVAVPGADRKRVIQPSERIPVTTGKSSLRLSPNWRTYVARCMAVNFDGSASLTDLWDDNSEPESKAITKRLPDFQELWRSKIANCLCARLEPDTELTLVAHNGLMWDFKHLLAHINNESDRCYLPLRTRLVDSLPLYRKVASSLTGNRLTDILTREVRRRPLFTDEDAKLVGGSPHEGGRDAWDLRHALLCTVRNYAKLCIAAPPCTSIISGGLEMKVSRAITPTLDAGSLLPPASVAELVDLLSVCMQPFKVPLLSLRKVRSISSADGSPPVDFCVPVYPLPDHDRAAWTRINAIGRTPSHKGGRTKTEAPAATAEDAAVADTTVVEFIDSKTQSKEMADQAGIVNELANLAISHNSS